MSDSTTTGDRYDVIIEARKTPMSPHYVAKLHVADRYIVGKKEPVEGSRAHLPFRNYDEIRKTIEELKKLLPAIERLGLIE